MIKTDLYNRIQFVLGQHVVHSWAELFFIEQILDKYHFDSLIETGTYEGGLSLFLGVHALRMNAKAVTFDIKPEPLNVRQGFYGKLKPLLPLEFHQLDCCSDEAVEIIKHYISLGRTLIYCDGGEKPKEFNLYAPLLKVGDVIMSHDRGDDRAVQVDSSGRRYGREIFYGSIKETVEKCKLAPFHDEEVCKLGAIFSFIKEG